MYQGLLNHYSLTGRRINPSKANENGDIEQRHHRFKRALEQSLLLRGSRDFTSREAYTDYLHELFVQLNSGRETICVRFSAVRLEVWYGQRHIETIPRLRGTDTHHIQYRHMINWLIRKPGAFANYRYRKDLFPTSRFCMAYDTLCGRHALAKAGKQ